MANKLNSRCKKNKQTYKKNELRAHLRASETSAEEGEEAAAASTAAAALVSVASSL